MSFIIENEGRFFSRIDDGIIVWTPLRKDAARFGSRNDAVEAHAKIGVGEIVELKKGFAAMSKEAISAIAHKGGKAAHAAGTAHEFSSDEAREAGRKGGRATHAKRRAAAEKAAE